MAQPSFSLGSGEEFIKKKIKVEGLVSSYVHELFVEPLIFIFD
jgi:hypothetical protein